MAHKVNMTLKSNRQPAGVVCPECGSPCEVDRRNNGGRKWVFVLECVKPDCMFVKGPCRSRDECLEFD